MTHIGIALLETALTSSNLQEQERQLNKMRGLMKCTSREIRKALMHTNIYYKCFECMIKPPGRTQPYMQAKGSLMVTHSAAGAKDSGFNSQSPEHI